MPDFDPVPNPRWHELAARVIAVVMAVALVWVAWRLL